MSCKNIWRCPKCNAKIKDEDINRIKHIGKCIGFDTVNKIDGGYQPKSGCDNSEGNPPKKP
jgi:hypothetical protein